MSLFQLPTDYNVRGVSWLLIEAAQAILKNLRSYCKSLYLNFPYHQIALLSLEKAYNIDSTLIA